MAKFIILLDRFAYMFLPVLKRFVIIIFIVASAVLAGAQQTHFVYLQTEDGQSFYVKMNNKIVSSSAAGYLILPKLPDSVYKLNVGFPKNEFPEENFQILIDKKNEGFLLKNFGEKGWGLFNMQSYSVVMGGNTATTAVTPKNLQDDSFSKLLANVVKDSSILEKSEPVKEETPVTTKIDSGKVKFDSIIAKADSTNAKVDSTIALLEKAAPLPVFPATRFLNKKNKDGREMIYIDHNENQDDTVRIFIPSGHSIIKAANADTEVVQNIKPPVAVPADSTPVVVEQPASQTKTDSALAASPEKKNVVENTDTVITKKMDEVKQPETSLQDSVTTPEIKTEAKKDDKGEAKKDDKKDDKKETEKDDKKDDIVVLPKVVESSATNSDCKAFAANEDFLKLRKKMASENSDDNMIKIAKKAFHTKCFSTEQIKNLSFLFLTNGGKYMFFDLAYPFASDADQYGTLEPQLTDSYYINRFKAMIHK
ncbi:MAG: DUF4476 domain-containing protein [Ginsengibacter sp.]